MLSSKELYEQYSSSPCEETFLFNDPKRGSRSNGAGTPYYFRRVIQFLKHVLRPCFKEAPGVEEIEGTGAGKICLPFRILQEFDIEAFKEIQPSIRSGTSHSIRNAVDILRACDYTASGTGEKWNHRSATEHMQYFGENSLPDCLMCLGPDLVHPLIASSGRAPGASEIWTSFTSESSLPDYSDLNLKGLGCVPGGGKGVSGADHSCVTPPSDGTTNTPEPECKSCGSCVLGEDGSPLNPDDPCCKYLGVPVPYNNLCCKAPLTNAFDFSYLVSIEKDIDTKNVRLTKNVYYFTSNEFSEDLNDVESIANISDEEEKNRAYTILENLKIGDAIVFQNNEVWVLKDTHYFDKRVGYNRYNYRLKHFGILERKTYGGYVNLLDNSGSNFYATIDNLFMQWVQGINGWDYLSHVSTGDAEVERVKTISLVLSADGGDGKIPTTNTTTMVNDIKDLICNGYGVVLFSNVGFPDSRDSVGIAYPDKIWYHTYAIIGYDDSRLDNPECLYVLSSPWGDWIKGGNPSWGPLPDGCFLVTESHLKCMIRFYPDNDFYGCRDKGPCNPVIHGDCENQSVLDQLKACDGHGQVDKCEPYYCTRQQSSLGLVFALSLSDGFYKRNLDYNKYYPAKKINQKFQETTLYYEYS